MKIVYLGLLYLLDQNYDQIQTSSSGKGKDKGYALFNFAYGMANLEPYI